jgi:hypothetical protein
MGRHIRRALPAFLLMATVLLIPVLALFTVPHPPPPACGRAGCRHLTLSAQSSQIQATRVEFTSPSVLVRPAPVAGTATPTPLP